MLIDGVKVSVLSTLRGNRAQLQKLIYRVVACSIRATPARADTAKTRASMRTGRCTKCRNEGDRRPHVPSVASCARRPTRIGLVTTARIRTKVRCSLSLLAEPSGVRADTHIQVQKSCSRLFQTVQAI